MTRISPWPGTGLYFIGAMGLKPRDKPTVPAALLYLIVRVQAAR